MKPWVAERMKTFVPALERLIVADEMQVAALCAEEIAAWRARPGIQSEFSLKEPLKNARSAISQIPLTDDNSYVNRHGEREHIALKHMTLAPEKWQAMKKVSKDKFHERLKHQLFLRQPDEIIVRIERLLQSAQWQDVAAGLYFATGRRLVEVLQAGMVRSKSLYSVWFAGQLKSDLVDEYEVPTLVQAGAVVAAWSWLRSLRDFSDVEQDRVSSSYGPAVSDVIRREFGDLVQPFAGRSLSVKTLRAAYIRLALFFFLPAHVQEIAYASAILGHRMLDDDGEHESDYDSSLYYMAYKIYGVDGTVDYRAGVKLIEPGVMLLEEFNMAEIEMAQAQMFDRTGDARTKIGVKHSTKAAFDEEQRVVGSATADEAVLKLVEDHRQYRQLTDLLAGASVQDVIEIVIEATEIALDDETALDCLRAALADKKRFRSTYEKRSASNAGRDYSAMSLTELKNARTPEASRERWRRAVDQIIAYNDAAAIPELRWFINAATVKALIGGRGTEIAKYLKERQAELDEHHKRHALRPGVNHGRTNIKERVLGDASPVEDDEEE